MIPKVQGNAPKNRARAFTFLARREETSTGKERLVPVLGTLVRLRNGRLVSAKSKDAVMELRLRRLERRAAG